MVDTTGSNDFVLDCKVSLTQGFVIIGRCGICNLAGEHNVYFQSCTLVGRAEQRLIDFRLAQLLLVNSTSDGGNRAKKVNKCPLNWGQCVLLRVQKVSIIPRTKPNPTLQVKRLQTTTQ